MNLYVRSPGSPVEARQVTEDSFDGILDWCSGHELPDGLLAWPLSEVAYARVGQWLIEDRANDRRFVLSDENFRKQYQLKGSR